MIKGDNKEAPCFLTPEEASPRQFPHDWSSLIMKEFIGKADDLQVCRKCFAMREVKLLKYENSPATIDTRPLTIKLVRR